MACHAPHSTHFLFRSSMTVVMQTRAVTTTHLGANSQRVNRRVDFTIAQLWAKTSTLSPQQR
eukprot:2495900-Prymnesium_polylepis.1